MKKIIATLLTLCLVTLVVPPILEGNDDGNYGISTCEYFYIDEFN